jgi:DNA-binding winged helix-turn-helix (wHTH) protein/tetratricopeptide (TPR) repeat protein
MVRMAKARYFAFEPFCLDVLDERLWRQDANVPMGHKAFAVLARLITQPNQLVTKDDLLASVWPETAVSEAVLTTAMREIRTAVGDTARAPRVVETVHGRGYRFIAPVAEASVRISSPVDQTTLAGERLGDCPPASDRSLVGREIEFARLREWFATIEQGRLRIGLICGEAGIGKSALVDAFIAGTRVASRARIAHGQCIEQYGAGEAYLPVLEALGRLGQDPEVPLGQVLRDHAPSWLAHLPSLAPHGSGAPAPVRPERMLRELTEALEVLTRAMPLVLVLEDLHWSDSATLEWLAYVARRRDVARLLVLGTYRPVDALLRKTPLRQVLAELRHQAGVGEVVLDYLPRAATDAYLRQRCGGVANLERFADVLYRRTGGHPLFLAAIVDDLIASRPDRLALATLDFTAMAQALPLNVRRFIEGQFERLPEEDQAILEAASVVGDRFTIATVAAGTSSPPDRVEARCVALTRTHRVLTPDGMAVWPDGTLTARYQFRHSLFQEAAYARISSERLARLHQKIGKRLEAAYARHTHAIAAELAVHFEHGREPGKAVSYLEQAARNALQRSAYVEAHGHLVHALENVQRMPGGRERLRRDATLALLQGHVLETTQGWGADDVARAYERAEALCVALRDGPRLLQAIWGLICVSVVRAELPKTQKVSRELLGLATRQRNPLFTLAAHMELGGTALVLGLTPTARKHFRAAEALHDPGQHQASVAAFGLDVGIFARIWATHLYWYEGSVDRARVRAEEALTLAEESGHPFTRTIALAYAAMLGQFQRDIDGVDRLTAAAIADAEAHGFPYYLAWARVLRGWCLATEGGAESAIEEMRRAIEVLQTIARLRLPYYRGLLADAYRHHGRRDEGLQVVAEALEDIRQSGECWWEAEIHRIRGDLLASTDIEEAENCYRAAIAVARGQAAKGLELRATASLRSLRGPSARQHGVAAR